MRSLRKVDYGYNSMEYVEVPEIHPKENEVKISVLYSGICGTDIHAFKGEYNKVIPLTLGHEFVGKIVEVGTGIKNLKIGMIVSSETTFETCGECEYCLNEEFNLCSSRKGIGTQIDGSFSEYVIAKSDRCHIIPNNISNQVAAMLEPLSCCTHAVFEKTIVNPEEQVAVFGPGPIGLIMSLVLKTCGAEVILIGIENDIDKLTLAKELGIDHTINSQKEDLTSEIDTITNSKGVDQIFECSGSIQAIHQAFDIVKKKGKIIQEGLPFKDFYEVNLSQLIHKEIEYIGSRTQKPSSWKISIELLRQEKIDLAPLISQVFSLEEWENAFDSVMSGEQIKVLIQP